MQRITDEGHEVACHGVDHWQPKETDFVQSKEIVEPITGRTVYGYRQPRMFPVVESEIKRAGYRYNSSLNPAFIPGRYMHLTEPRTWFNMPVATKRPNELGLYDMSGNVWEWCDTPYAPYANDQGTWFTRFIRSRFKVVRGSGFRGYARYARVSNRYAIAAWRNDHTVGLRLVMQK